MCSISRKCQCCSERLNDARFELSAEQRGGQLLGHTFERKILNGEMEKIMFLCFWKETILIKIMKEMLKKHLETFKPQPHITLAIILSTFLCTF